MVARAGHARMAVRAGMYALPMTDASQTNDRRL